jgi:hypothetical protein
VSNDPKLTTVERIAIGGQLGGIVRGNAKQLTQRKVKVVDAHGNVLRVSDLAEVHKRLRERVGIEFDVHENVRPTKAECHCGRVFTTRVLLNGRTVTVCPNCQNQKVCAGCDGPCPTEAKPPLSALLSQAIQNRKGAPWRCTRCRYKLREINKREARGGLCKKGHPPTPDNVVVRTAPNGRTYKTCLLCQRQAMAKSQKRRGEEAVARGMCKDCCKRRIDPKSKSRCRVCLDAQRERGRAMKDTKK